MADFPLANGDENKMQQTILIGSMSGKYAYQKFILVVWDFAVLQASCRSQVNWRRPGSGGPEPGVYQRPAGKKQTIVTIVFTYGS